MFDCKSLILLLLIAIYFNNGQSQGDIDFKNSETDSLSQLLLELNGISKFAEKARQLNVQDIDPVDDIEIYEFQGWANYLLGENDKAQQSHFKGLRIADSLQLDNKVTEISNAIGSVYNSMNDYANAEKYFLLVIEKAKKIEHETIYNMAIGNLAIVYTNLEKYKEAEDLILESIETAMAGGASSMPVLGANYNNIAVIYYKQNKYIESIEYLKKALDIAEEINDPSSIAMRHCNLGEVYTDLQNYKLAKKHLNIGMELAKNIENREIYKSGLLGMVGLYVKIGNHERALDNYKEYATIKDSILNKKRMQIVAELEEKYEAAKKELEIISLSEENIEAQNKLKLLRYLILGLCFGLLGFVAFIYFIRQNHKKNAIIQKNDLKIAADKIEILEKNKEITKLSSLIMGQEYERERLAKEMHDGLGGLLAISHSKLTNLSAKNEVSIATIEESKNLVGEAYNQVRQISHNLMPLDLQKFGLLTTLQNMIGIVHNENDIHIDFRTYNFDLVLNNDLGLNIYRIVQESITNILKYAEAKNVLIELIQHKQQISLSIEDDGVGLDLTNFKSGIGIQNMRNRTELFNGTFNLESNLGVGTSISVQIPFPVHGTTQSQT